MDAEYQSFGTERLVDHLLQSCQQPLPDMLLELRNCLQDWRNGLPFDDDVSLIALEYQPREVQTGQTGFSVYQDTPKETDLFSSQNKHIPFGTPN